MSEIDLQKLYILESYTSELYISESYTLKLYMSELHITEVRLSLVLTDHNTVDSLYIWVLNYYTWDSN